ncbi:MULTISPECIES: DUF1425 domain-containing protein [Sphingobium]|uniref:Uncharacterized protein YcfL n=1 Tax=Sphingobium lignivorans TaxID=2735886 RepID=A0ABR6NER2_9SPHN|nr:MULTISPECIES: DUF1425 domain-containing protein [Sphingobium]MBB5985741.1 uncharacterized protein YcfL [Sphingobium lignivorans]BAK66350.1 hypothetical protein SLG_16750 [Sphingobium sp. SYK-6]
MTVHRIAALAATAAAAAMLAGCSATMPEGGVRIDNQNYVRPTLNTVRVIDESLARYKNRKWEANSVLDVENVVLSDTGTGFKRISVELRNKTGVEIPLEVRNSWYDPNGRPVDAASSWTRLFVKPQSMVLFEQVASNGSASQYYVEVRAAQ